MASDKPTSDKSSGSFIIFPAWVLSSIAAFYIGFPLFFEVEAGKIGTEDYPKLVFFGIASFSSTAMGLKLADGDP